MNYSDENYEEEERIKKQNYLKTQILNDNNYDANEFLDFMDEAKPGVDGQDINNWEYDELVEKVQQFKAEKENFDGKIY